MVYNRNRAALGRGPALLGTQPEVRFWEVARLLSVLAEARGQILQAGGPHEDVWLTPST
jgi:hypothetical protein